MDIPSISATSAYRAVTSVKDSADWQSTTPHVAAVKNKRQQGIQQQR